MRSAELIFVEFLCDATSGDWSVKCEVHTVFFVMQLVFVWYRRRSFNIVSERYSSSWTWKGRVRFEGRGNHKPGNEIP